MSHYPPGLRTARIPADQVHTGDELMLTGGGWYRVVDVVDDRSLPVVGVWLDEPDPQVRRLPRDRPVVVRWAMPATTAAMAADLRRPR